MLIYSSPIQNEFFHSVKMGNLDDFIMTIDSDSEEQQVVPPTSSKKSGSKSKPGQEEDAALNPDFTFDLSIDPYADHLEDAYDLRDHVTKGTKPVCCNCACVEVLTNL